MNFAVVRAFGKQHLVAEGDIVAINATIEGKTFEFAEVLLLSVDNDLKIGTPLVSGAVVKAEIIKTGKGEKLDIYKFKAKSRYRRHTGFRPLETQLKILSIGAKVAPVAVKTSPKPKTPAKKAKKKLINEERTAEGN